MERRLPGLDSLRGLAATVVLVWHVDRFALLLGNSPIGYGKSLAAEYAVVFFLTLSGFLMTLILSRECSSPRRFSLKKFYIRRGLRILPAYYLVLLFSIPIALLLNYKLWPTSYLLSVLLLPQVNYAIPLGLIFLYPLWTVGVEIQFYLVWPILLRRIRGRLSLALGIGTAYLVIKLVLLVFEKGLFYRLWSLSACGCFMIGAATAFAHLDKNERLLRLMLHPVVQVSCWTVTLFEFAYGFLSLTGLLNWELHSVFYAVIILNTSTNGDSLVRLDNPVSKRLGVISYGVYLYHLPLMAFWGGVLKSCDTTLPSGWTGTVVGVLLVFSTTVLFSEFSFRFFELPVNKYGRQVLDL